MGYSKKKTEKREQARIKEKKRDESEEEGLQTVAQRKGIGYRVLKK